MMSAAATTVRALAERVGIFDSYVDNGGVERVIGEDTRRALITALGYDVKDEVAAARALAGLDEERAAQVVEPVRVVRAGEAARMNARTTAFGPGSLLYEVTAKAEDGGAERVSRGQARVAVDGAVTGLCAPALEPGTYQLSVRLERAGIRRTVSQWLAVAPASCTPLREVVGDRRAYGIWANLYSVRSRRGLGIGNVSDLAKLTRFAGEHGADFVGLNPLHALRNRETEISPYGPVSRLFRNPLYLDVTRVPELAACDEARARMSEEGFTRALERARMAERIDYERVARLQRPLLEALWRAFRSGTTAARSKAFERYRNRMGATLRDFGTFCSIEEQLAASGAARDWRLWPSGLRDHGSAEVAAFREQHADDVDFHVWVQFELDRQLEAVARSAQRSGMAIGLYTDVAVGSLASGFDAWAFPGLFLDEVHLGAPPDAYSATGQDWALPPLHPHRLRADQFRYWRLLLRAALDHCGMLRLDHAMGVLRQFWIPAGRSGAEGAYVGFPADDLLGLLALESRRQRAVVVAEDLGTVPKGFDALLARHGILSSQVMFFERTADNGFVRAASYSGRALLTANTHDQATLVGWWSGGDIEIGRCVGMITDDEGMASALGTRVRERDLLLRRLRSEHALDETRSPPTFAELTRGVYRYLADAPAPLLGVSLDDLALEAEPVNVPGVSVNVYPSWSRRMRAELAEIARSRDACETLEALGERPRPRRRAR